ncbi:23S rRNA (uracil(1939)-C(5))-methyltransferase RlmD [Marinicellulosiphila megalodicopiae]|uniref:23S rRNA (uracil(1939)-C(5))-methyltransferase RlmD n=1 Tax=Marinicellulosiphila megalodicopiae TaxID=2724896 RepID=UPI003BB1A635
MIRKRLPKKTKSAVSKQALKPFDATQLIDIDRLSHEGDGIGFSQGYTVTVPFSLPGETILIKHPKYDERSVLAVIDKIEKVSDKRIEPACEYFAQCGGCDLQHVDYQEQIELKQSQFLWQFKDLLYQDLKGKKKSKIEKPLLSEPFEYRHRIRLSVNDGKIGFKQAGSNNVIQVDSCLITHPLLQAKLSVSQDDVVTQLHSLQSVEWLIDDNEQIAIRLILKKMPNATKLAQLSEYLAEHEVHNIRVEGGSEIWQNSENLTQKIEYLTYQYRPGQFTQVNTSVNQKMIAQAQRWILDSVGKNEAKLNQALDLFCGMGNFTLMLAKHFKHTIGMEGAKESIQCALQNTKENQKQSEPDKKSELNELTFLKQDLFDPSWHERLGFKTFDLVVLDPPRAGAKQICSDIDKIDCDYLLYISCNQATLKRDAQLLKRKNFVIERAGIMDMFAQTHHIETMVLFKKK